MKVKRVSGIESMHGKIGNVCFRTLKNGTVVMCRMPRKRAVKKASAAQEKQRERFCVVAKKVKEVMQNTEQLRAMEILYKQYGDKGETLRGFVFRQIDNLLRK